MNRFPKGCSEPCFSRLRLRHCESFGVAFRVSCFNEDVNTQFWVPSLGRLKKAYAG